MHVNDLVDAARFDASTLTLDPIEVDVHDVLQQAVDQARAMTTTHRFRIDIPPAVPPPRWDPDRVRQALLHVLSNAIKYWPEGGQIAIKARPQLEGVVISVRDRGLGVPPQEQERVFERYFRLADRSGAPSDSWQRARPVSGARRRRGARRDGLDRVDRRPRRGHDGPPAAALARPRALAQPRWRRSSPFRSRRGRILQFPSVSARLSSEI